MYTSILLVAMVGFEPAPNPAGSLTWLTDYGQAQRQGRSEEKPLAVFVGSGPRGYEKVSEEGRLSAQTRQMLAENYVCVYLDTDSTEGRRLARALKVSEPTGVVLSDRTGDLQAFHYPGQLTNGELSDCLKRFADPEYVVRTTVTSPYERVSFYPPQTETPTTPAAGTQYSPAPAYAPAINYGGFGGGFGGFGGGFGGFGGGRGGC